MSIGFTEFFTDLRDGRAHSELSQQLSELITKVKETGKCGELMLKLRIKPASRGGDVEKVMISDQITMKLPKPKCEEESFYLTDKNTITKENPKQHLLELREVIQERPPLEKANPMNPVTQVSKAIETQNNMKLAETIAPEGKRVGHAYTRGKHALFAAYHKKRQMAAGGFGSLLQPLYDRSKHYMQWLYLRWQQTKIVISAFNDRNIGAKK